MPNKSVYTGWMYRGRRPSSDSGYFENLTRCVFQSGLNWEIIAARWPDFKEAFDSFEIEKVAGYGSQAISRLMADGKIIRNRKKILATIHNAREFERISSDHGNFQTWLDKLDKKDNYKIVSKQLSTRFKHVGPKISHIFLYSVGEEIKYDESIFRKQPKRI